MSLAQEISLLHGRTYSQPLGLFINNEFINSKGGNSISVLNPATNMEVTKVVAASEEDVDIAVEAARAAFEGEWRELASNERGRLINKLADLIERDIDLFSAIDSLDNGKPLESAHSDMTEVVNVFRYYAGFSDKNFGKTIETSPAKFAYTLHEPLGVCAQIIPWNFPMLVMNGPLMYSCVDALMESRTRSVVWQHGCTEIC